MLMMVTGGSGSGKSEFAESLVTGLADGPNLYIATMFPFDEECHKRIARHREMRKDKGFDTLECYTGLKHADVSGYHTVLLECMSNLTANEMYQEKGSGDHCVEEILAGICHVKEQCRNLIIVTNEIFSDGMDYDEKPGGIRSIWERSMVRMASMADLVAEVVYSIPLIHKGDLNEVFGR